MVVIFRVWSCEDFGIISFEKCIRFVCGRGFIVGDVVIIDENIIYRNYIVWFKV